LILIGRIVSFAQWVDVPEYCYAVVVSTPSTYDFQYERYEQGLSVHGVYMIFNGTLEYRSLIKGNSNSLASFVGIGIGHLIALQYGLQGTIRLRADIAVFNKESPSFGKWTKVGYPRKGIALSFIIENQVHYGNAPWLLGFGIGIYF